ncbi:hypothetical protein ACWFR1_40020 [Streptomyces sp. NPDC055103]
MSRLRDGGELNLPGPAFLRDRLLHKLDATEIGELLQEFRLIPEESEAPEGSPHVGG